MQALGILGLYIEVLQGRFPPFEEPRRAKRRYPGEPEANYLLGYIDCSAPSKRREILKILGRFREAERDQRESKTAPRRPTGQAFRARSSELMAKFAMFLLYQQGRIARIRQCLHCRSWFYARFEHKRFCSKRCQFAHYHTPEWRKKNRERNRKHQRAYRETLFGKRR